MLLSMIAFAPVIYIGGLTTIWLFSPEFAKEVDCWLEPNNGHWMTPNEAHIMGLLFFGLISLVASGLVFLFLVGSKSLGRRTAVLIVVASIASGLAVFAINAQTNDGYIDRLYKACGRMS